MKMNIFSKENGMTIVSLIITIIVMLILAAVSISIIMGNNGPINKAESTKLEGDASEFKSELNVALSKYNQGDYVGSSGIFEFLSNEFEDNSNVTVSEDNRLRCYFIKYINDNKKEIVFTVKENNNDEYYIKEFEIK